MGHVVPEEQVREEIAEARECIPNRGNPIPHPAQPEEMVEQKGLQEPIGGRVESNGRASLEVRMTPQRGDGAIISVIGFTAGEIAPSPPSPMDDEEDVLDVGAPGISRRERGPVLRIIGSRQWRTEASEKVTSRPWRCLLYTSDAADE